MCRILFAITHGEQASKRRAAEFAAKNYPEWVSLLDRTLQWRETSGRVGGTLSQDETARFVQFTTREVANYVDPSA
jgi:hypothetical protein